MNRRELRTEPGRIVGGVPQPRTLLARACRVTRLALLTIWIAVVVSWPVAAGPSEMALPGFPDVTGRSGETPAVFLNPAAAAGLLNPTVGLWAVVPDPNLTARPPAYALALLDPGGRLAGGLVVTLTDDRTKQPLALSYSAAGRLGPVSLGVRPVWTREERPEGVWTLDAGFAWEMAPWASVGIATLDLPLTPADPTPPSSRGLAGLTLTATGLAGTLLEGTQLALGLSDRDLEADTDLVALAGLRLPLGPSFRLLAGYEHNTASGESLGWSGSLALRAGQFLLDLGYQTDAVYHLGIEAGW